MTKVTLSSQAILGNSGQVWTSDVIGNHHVSFTMHLALRFNLSCGVMLATAQLCSPKVVRDFHNPSFAQTCPNPNASKAMVNHRSYIMCHL